MDSFVLLHNLKEAKNNTVAILNEKHFTPVKNPCPTNGSYSLPLPF